VPGAGTSQAQQPSRRCHP